MPLETITYEETPFAQPPQGTDLPVDQPGASFGAGFGAGFAMENEISNLVSYMQQQDFAPDPKFNALTFGEARPLFLEYPEKLALAKSEDEFLALEMRIKEEQGNLAVMASNPFAGFVGAAVGALISPVSLLPLTGQARGAKGVAQAFALAAGASTAQEAALFGLQETRTPQDFAMGVTFGTVLGGLLGSAAVGLRGAQLREIERTIAEKQAQGAVSLSRFDETGARVETQFPTIIPVRERVLGEIETALLAVGRGAEAVETPQMRALGVANAEDATRVLETLEQTPSETLEAFVRARTPAPEEQTAALARVRAEAEQAVAAADPPINPGMLRVYHSGAVAEDGAQIASPSKDFAAGQNAEQPLYFTDLPITDNRLLAEGSEEGAQPQLAQTIKLTPEEAQTLKPIKRGEADTTYADSKVREAEERFAHQADEIETQVARLSEPTATGRTGGSVGAAAVRNAPRGLDGKNVVTGPLIDFIAKINPLTRLLNGRFSSSRFWAANLQNPNLLLDFGDPLGAARSAAEDGTIQARTLMHYAPAADFIIAYDRAYANYLAGKNIADQFGQLTLAKIKSAIKVPEGKMTYSEFGEVAYDLANTAGEHSDPFVMDAVKAQRTFYDHFERVADDYYAERSFVDGEDARPLFVPFEGDATGAKEYVRHLPDVGTIVDNQDEFIREVSEWAQRLDDEAFAGSFARYSRTKARNDQMQALLQMSEEDTKVLHAEVRAEISVIEENPVWQNAKTQLSELRKLMRASGADEAEIRKEVRAMEENIGTAYSDLEARRKKLVLRRSMLEQIGATATESERKFLDEVGKLERMQENQLDSVIAAAFRVQKKLDRVSDEVLDAEFDKLQQRLKKEISVYNKHVNAVEDLEARSEFAKADVKEELVRKADARTKELLRKIEKAEGVDRAEIRADIEEVLRLSKEKAVRLNGKRAVRAERLQEKAKQVSPEEKAKFRAEELEAVRARQAELTQKFEEKWIARGASELDMDNGSASFEMQAQNYALELMNKLTGSEGRIAGLDILSAERGPQLARVWNMPYKLKKKWLIRNPEYNVRSYVHSMAPDLELYRATGSPNGARMFDELTADIKADREQLAAKEYKSQAEKEKAFRQFEKDAKQAMMDLQGLVERLRHQRGMPQNAEGFMYRLGRAARNLNTSRFMGTVLISSLPDVARPVFRYGMTSTFRNAWAPLVTDLNQVKMTRAQAYRFGIALDPLLHNRASQIFDAGENVQVGRVKAKTAAGRGVQNAEKALEILANRTGQVALFDRWTAEMKHRAFGVTIAETSNALRIVNEGGASAKELAAAQQQLADMSIGPNMQRRIWEQYKLEGGSDEFDGGFRLPNTDKWEDQQAVRALAAGVNNIVDDLIITPSLDRPLWMDANEGFRVLGQFRSFTFTATTRIMLASLQRRDAAALQGIIFSVGLGGLSHMVWSVSVGKFDEYANLDTEQKIYEAVDRSGMLGVLSEGIRVGEQIPGLNDFAVFGGSGSTTRRANSVYGSIAGPSFDLGERIIRTMQGISDPTQSTLNTARSLVPYQNVFWLRLQLDAVQEGLGEALGLPER